MKYLAVLFLFFLSIKSSAQTSIDGFSFSPPENLASLTSLQLWATQYYIHQFQSSGNISIVKKDGTPTGLYADTCNFCEASLEGTAWVTDSSGKVVVINYAGQGDKMLVNCRRCKKYAKSKLNVESWGKALWTTTEGFGLGVKNYRLVPFRTIAVDKLMIPYGSVIYIPQAKGKEIILPDMSKVTHDGYFFAGDTGGAIKQNHIDVFTGIYSGNPFSGVITSNANKTFQAYLVSDTAIIHKLAGLHTR